MDRVAIPSNRRAGRPTVAVSVGNANEPYRKLLDALSQIIRCKKQRLREVVKRKINDLDSYPQPDAVLIKS